jgi:GT2 family glycosyltransferase
MEKIAGSNTVDVSISVVSHMQMALVVQLLTDIGAHCSSSNLEVILTLNLDEALPIDLNGLSFPIKLLRNESPKGFGANHNQAFRHASGRYFCVMNPDIRLDKNPFETLRASLADTSVGVVAPLVLDANGEVEDSARRFPTPLTILCKAMGRCKGTDYVIGDEPIHPDWVGGMCMLFSSAVFERLDGFDERYFLYYEDVDLCARLRLQGFEVMLNPAAKVTHHAQRTSRRNLTYLRWHFKSMMRFFLSPACWRLHRLGRP